MDNFTLGSLYIGDTDGEYEAERRNMENLYFDANNIYHDFMDNTLKFLIIGGKGAGKTYFAHYICKKKTTSQNYKIVSAKNFFSGINRSSESFTTNRGYIYELSRWLVLVQVAKYILELHPYKAGFLVPSSIYRLHTFVCQHDNLCMFKASKSKTSSGLKCLFGAKFKKKIQEIGEGNFSIEKLRELEFERTAFYEVLNALEDLVIKSISQNDDILIFFDDLDDLENREMLDNGSESIILNLIKYTKDFNKKVRDKGKMLRVAHIIRADIIDRLQFYDSNLAKIKTSYGVELYWLQNAKVTPETHPLMKMIIHKVKMSNDLFFEKPDIEVYEQLFPEQIEEREPLDFLISYSMGRPRDIVSFLNHAIKNHPEKSAFSATVMKSVKAEYADDFYAELLNQSYYHANSNFVKECFSLLVDNKKISFKLSEVKECFDRNKERYPNIPNIESCLNFLYSMSAIGNTWKKTDTYYTTFAYRKDGAKNLDIRKKMIVHNGIKKKV